MINLKAVDTGLRLPSIQVGTNLKILEGVFQIDFLNLFSFILHIYKISPEKEDNKTKKNTKDLFF